MSRKISIVEGNTNSKDNVRVLMVKGEKGEKGFSPTLTVIKKNGVATITITDEKSTKSIQISDGELSKEMVIDNLTSAIMDQPLSANQGKVLKTLLDAKANSSDVYSKNDTDNLLSAKQATVLSGTNAPSSSLGEDGDVYLQYS